MRKIFIMFILCLFQIQLVSKTSIETEANPRFENISLGPGEISNLGNQYQDKLDKNGPNAASVFLFSNMLGYANGTPHITKLEFGLAFGGGLGNMGYLDKTARAGTYPLVSPVVNLHAGMPLSKNSDVIIKISMFDMVVTGQKPVIMDVKVDSLGEFLIGAKYRHTFFERKPIMPFILEFEGITLGASADILNGSSVLNKEYEMKIDQVGIDPGNGTVTPIDTEMRGTLTAQIRWIQFSTAYDCVAYFTTFRAVSLYGGFGMLVGYSWLGVDATTNGYLYATDNTLDADIGNGFNYEQDYLMKLDYDSLSVYTPFPLLPYFTTGMEISVSQVKLLFESAVNLGNRRDVTALCGIRYQM